jgi:predicted enzyme related to lactoylglutathione lyase
MRHCGLRTSFIVMGLLFAWTTAVSAAGEGVAAGRFTGEIIFPIYVTDVEVSAAFYRDVLGFQFLGYYDYEVNAYTKAWQDSVPPNYAGFVAGNQKFGLHKPGNEAQTACVGCSRYYFRVEDVDAEHERIFALGVEVSAIQTTALLRRFFVRDPDGLLVFFAETVEGAPLDPW